MDKSSMHRCKIFERKMNALEIHGADYTTCVSQSGSSTECKENLFLHPLKIKMVVYSMVFMSAVGNYASADCETGVIL